MFEYFPTQNGNGAAMTKDESLFFCPGFGKQANVPKWGFILPIYTCKYMNMMQNSILHSLHVLKHQNRPYEPPFRDMLRFRKNRKCSGNSCFVSARPVS